MVNKKKTTEDILVKVDHNNVIYIDPNSVLSNGNVESRSVEPENLVMYVNLEAELIPRTTLITGDQKTNMISISSGMINFLQNNNSKDYDTTWTDSYFDKKTKTNDPNDLSGGFYQSDSTGQSFGMTGVDIKIQGMNFIPEVTIRFVDVRGKTLFESPENSPYQAFFHLPWPIFYLTVKGYYGKAIRYRLHLVTFNSRFNSSNGNFEIETKFVGSTYAYMADIPLDAIMNAGYMYPMESTRDLSKNEKTDVVKQKLKKTSRGYVLLKSVYDEYKQKGLIPKDFPNRTLPEVLVLAKRLNKQLEKVIFEQVADPLLLNAIKKFENDIQEFEGAIKGWQKLHLSPIVKKRRPDSDDEYNVVSEKNNSNSEWVLDVNKKGSLEQIINLYVDILDKNPAFGNNIDKTLIKSNDFPVKTISFNSLRVGFESKYTAVIDNAFCVNIYKLYQDFYEISNNFVNNKFKIETYMGKKINNIVKNKNKEFGTIGIGFEPTIRNIVGVISANADTYIRLMKEVHAKAFQAAEERKEKLKGLSTDNIRTDQLVYPWPEVKKPVSNLKQNVLVYPGSLEMEKILGSNDRRLWPEVEFVDNFMALGTWKLDPLTEKEGNAANNDFIFEDNTELASKSSISTFDYLTNTAPYFDKTISSILYEIWERAFYITSLESFNNVTIEKLALVEYNNLKNQIVDDYDLIEILKTKIYNIDDLRDMMMGFSPFERYPYYLDQLPTVPYIKSTLDSDFKIEKYIPNPKPLNDDKEFQDLSENLRNYIPENYRSKIYPFNSTTYLTYLQMPVYSTYLKQDVFDPVFLDLGYSLKVRTNDAFISSPIEPKVWVKSGYEDNLFTNTFTINGVQKNILNTPYFHRQLSEDFYNDKVVGKYASSAYLFLNSLPFKDLIDPIKFVDSNSTNGVPMSTIFREIGATHFIPYHLILKWGAIYHRYKTYILEGNDILSNVTTSLNEVVNFDNNVTFGTYSFVSPTTNVDENVTRYSDTPNSIGLNPFYQSIFHQIVHGYTFYDSTLPPLYTPPIITSTRYTDYYQKSSDKSILNFKKVTNHNVAWTSVIDNSKYVSTDLIYTLLPSNGNKNYIDLSDYFLSEQENYNILWNSGDSTVIPTYSGRTFSEYDTYMNDIDGDFSIDSNNRKIIDLIATFKPDILDQFENAFLSFSSEFLYLETPNDPFYVTDNTGKSYSMKYNNFQSLLKEIVTVVKKSGETAITPDILQTRQTDKLKNLTNEILSSDNLIKITLSNPKEIDPYLLGGFTNLKVQNFDYGDYDDAQLEDNLDYIKLYLGEDIDHYYQNFFAINNIKVTEENIKNFRFLIYTYAGYVNGQPINWSGNTYEAFSEYLVKNIINKEGNNNTGGQIQRLKNFINILTSRFRFLKPEETSELTVYRGYNDEPMRLELYNFFKSFNDKWIAGNSIGQRTLMEEFLFLDKANKDIGDSVYVDLEKFAMLLDQVNFHKVNLFTAINILIKDSGFDIRTLPAYVNFYGTNFSNNVKIMPSKTVAKNLFGTFLEVDYQESSPKVILQYIGPTSKHLDLKDISKKNLFEDDSFDVSNVNSNPVVIAPEVFRKLDFSKSNKVVAFEVSFGDQNQSIFKSVELDQSTIKNTSASFDVLERLGSQQAGASTAQIDIGLYDIYRQASYSCTVNMMGNAMIQPTMYFYLKNIPMFKGSYWITEVNHSIKPTGIETSFTGNRIPFQSLPDPADSFLATYRAIFDKITQKAITRVKDSDRKMNETSGTSVSAGTSGSSDTKIINVSKTTVKVVEFDSNSRFSSENKVPIMGITEYGVPYNGYLGTTHIEKIDYGNTPKMLSDRYGNIWLKARALQMGSPAYMIDDVITMSFPTYYNSKKVTWGDIKNNNTNYFYSCIFDSSDKYSPSTILDGNNGYPLTQFLNPKTGTFEQVLTKISEQDITENTYQGVINNGPSKGGIGMSKALMEKLGLFNEDIVYFRLVH